MQNEQVTIRFTLDAKCDWVEARDDEPAYKECTASTEQVARVRADAGLRFKPRGKRVYVVAAKVSV